MRNMLTRSSVNCDSSRLNEDQRKIISYALAEDSRRMAPLVVYGAFSTGKTEALAQTTLELASQLSNKTRVLVCTRTNAYVCHAFCRITYDISVSIF